MVTPRNNEGTDQQTNTSASTGDGGLAAAIAAMGGGTSDFDPSIPRPGRPVAGYKPGYPGKSTLYTGPNRTTADNTFEYINGVAQTTYDEVKDAKRILYSLDDIDRREILNRVKIAVGGSYNPTKGGLEDRDVAAVGVILRQANALGRTFDVALDYMIKDGGGYLGSTGGGAKKIQVTSSDDIKPVANELAIQLLGSTLSPEKMDRLVKFVQQEDARYQQTSSGMVEQPASVQNIVTQQLLEQDPQAAQVEGTASIVQMVQKALGG